MPDLDGGLERLRSHMEAATAAVQVELHGQRATLLTTEPRARETLFSVFGRQARVTDAGRPDAAGWRVGCLRSDELYHAWSRRFESAVSAGCPVTEVRRWDGDPAALRADLADHVAVVRHTTPFTGITVFAQPMRLSAYLLPAAEQPSVHHVEHLVKYPLRVGCWTAGGVEAHSATCRYRDRGVVMMGFRHSGKTTLAMHLLSRGGGLLGSDLVLLRAGPGGLAAAAIPAVCRIAAETIEDNAYLRASVPSSPHGPDHLRGRVFFDGKHELYPPALDDLFGRPVAVATCAADLIVFPGFSRDRAGQRLRWLPAHEAQVLVRERLVTDKPLPDWLPFAEVHARAGIEARSLDGLVERLPPVAQLEFGREDTLDWGEIDEAVDGA